LKVLDFLHDFFKLLPGVAVNPITLVPSLLRNGIDLEYSSAAA